MSTEITNSAAAGIAMYAGLRSGLATVKAQLPSSVGGLSYLRLLKDGQWVIGKNDDVVAPGTEAVVNVLSIQHGYSCWTNRAPGQGKNEKLGEEMWGVTTPKTPVSQLPVHHDPRTQEHCEWKPQMSMELKFITGAQAGVEALYAASSVGGLRVMGEIIDALMARLDEGTAYIFPIVEVSSTAYNHQSYGRTYVPVMKIVGWADKNGNEDGEPEVASETAARREPDPVVTKPVDAVASAKAEVPTGRRRRI